MREPFKIGCNTFHKFGSFVYRCTLEPKESEVKWICPTCEGKKEMAKEILSRMKALLPDEATRENAHEINMWVKIEKLIMALLENK